MAANPIPISNLNFEIVKTPDEIIVHCTGKINSSTTAELQARVRELIPQTKCVVLDLTDVSYMDSSGLGAIVGLYLSAKKQQRGLRLINLNKRLQDLLRITNLAAVFQGHEEFLGLTPD